MEYEKPGSSRIKMMGETAFSLFFNIYFILGIFIAAPYFNYCYARDNGFVKWILFGEVVPTMQSMIWPYYAAASLYKDPEPNWSNNEIENLKHLYDSEMAVEHARQVTEDNKDVTDPQLRIETMRDTLTFQKLALREAKQVDLELLPKVHPEMPMIFKEKYILFLELSCDVCERTLRMVSSGIRPDIFIAQEIVEDSKKADNYWIDWAKWNAENSEDIHLPYRLPE